jgi:flagellar biosynthesis protein FliP
MKRTTKTIALTFSLFMLISTLTFAGDPGNMAVASKETLRREMIRNITCPDFVTENTPANDVKALVSVDENGTITLHEINSANPQLKAYVIKRLKEMKLNNSITSEKFVLVVKFRVE